MCLQTRENEVVITITNSSKQQKSVEYKNEIVKMVYQIVQILCQHREAVHKLCHPVPPVQQQNCAETIS